VAVSEAVKPCCARDRGKIGEDLSHFIPLRIFDIDYITALRCLAEGPQELGRLLAQLEVGYQIGAPGVAGQLLLNPSLEQLLFMMLQYV